jgi:predicted nucleic acid-binding protein
MRRIVVDASVLLGWFAGERDRRGQARRLRAEYEAGALSVVVPSVVFLEVLDATARATGWDQARLAILARDLESLGLEVREPVAGELAFWMARGLGGQESAYAALASGEGIPLATQDERLLRIAAAVVQR